MADDFCAGRATARAPAIDFCHCHVPKALTAPCTGETSPAKGALPTKRNCRCSHELPKGPDLVPLSDQLLSQLVALWGTHLPSAPLQTQLLADLPWCSIELSAQELLTPASSTPPEGEDTALPAGRTRCLAVDGPQHVQHSGSSSGAAARRQSGSAGCHSRDKVRTAAGSGIKSRFHHHSLSKHCLGISTCPP